MNNSYLTFSAFIRISIFIIALTLITGCAVKERTVTVYQEVYIPQKCTTPEPIKPPPADSVALMVLDLRRYAEEAIFALRACKGE